jgi:hypothetical protein
METSADPSDGSFDDNQARLVFGSAIAMFGDLSYFKRKVEVVSSPPLQFSGESNLVDSALGTLSEFASRVHINTGLDEYQLLQTSLLTVLSKLLVTSSSINGLICSLPLLPSVSVVDLKQATQRMRLIQPHQIDVIMLRDVNQETSSHSSASSSSSSFDLQRKLHHGARLVVLAGSCGIDHDRFEARKSDSFGCVVAVG